MRDDKYFSRKVNPLWFLQHIPTIFNKIYDLLDKQENPSDTDLLIMAWIEHEFFKNDLIYPDSFYGIRKPK